MAAQEADGVRSTAAAGLPEDLSPFEQELYADLAPKPKEPPLQPNFDAEAADRYATARAATLQRKQTFDLGAIGRTLQAGAQGAEHRLTDAEIPQQFLKGVVEPERVAKYIAAVGGDAQAVGHMRDALVNDLREKGIIQADGMVRADAFAKWQARRARTIALFPGLSDELGTAEAAQRTFDQATAAHTSAVREFEKSAAARFIHDDPMVAVRKAFASGNPTNTFGQLVRAVRGDVDAEAGLRRAVVDFITEKMVSATPAGTTDLDFLKPATFRNWVRQNSGPLKAIFGGQGVQDLDMVAADLRRQAQPSTTAVGSDTTQKLLGVHGKGLGPKVAHTSALGILMLAGEHLGEQLHGGLMGSIVGAVALPAAGELIHSMRQAGMATINDLVREAMLNPQLARALVARVNAGSKARPAMMRLVAALQATTASQISRSAGKEQQQ